jgi:hypothetical protein
MKSALAALAIAVTVSCGAPAGPSDAGLVDAGTTDAGPGDAGTNDAGALRPWNPNEVSILFPLPTDGALLLPLSLDGGAHRLISEELVHRLGNPDAGLPRLIETLGYRDVYPEMRVVAARLDPCFDGPSPLDGSCSRQVRLVAQYWDPMYGGVSDAAIHLFYELSEARFIDLLARLRALSRSTPVTGPLAPHPVLTSEGLVGPFSDEVRSILLSACSTTNLTRFTFMTTGRGGNWFFFSLDRQADGGFAQSEIKGRGRGDGFEDHGNPGERTGNPFDVPWFPDALTRTDSTRTLSEPAFASAYDLLAKLANPLLTLTRDVSCAACHLVDVTQTEALRERDAGMPPPTPSAYGVLLPTSSFQRGNLHAFSYAGVKPSISQRAANETNEVIRFLSSSAFLQSLSPQDRARLE